jgi:hypothetical protein
MTALPTICDHCGAMFMTRSAIEMGHHTRGLTLVNVGVPCQNCGRQARILDGVYDAMGDTVRIAATSANSAKSLERFRRLLEESRASGADAETVARRIKEEAPEFTAVAVAVSTRQGRDFYDSIVLLLLVLSTLIAFRETLKPDITSEQIDQIVQRAIESARPSLPHPEVEQIHRPKTGRNELCPCGSGRKYKKCHLLVAP